jgi:CTP:molybdopterin cytidylyltransferase MocA
MMGGAIEVTLMKITAVLLAAGQGTRMKSDLPKVLHPLCGKPMLWHVLEALKSVTTERPVVVVGYGAEAVKNYVGDSAECVLQELQLGTAHAALQAGLCDCYVCGYAASARRNIQTTSGNTASQLWTSQPVDRDRR